jgi:hypothetical protein
MRISALVRGALCCAVAVGFAAAAGSEPEQSAETFVGLTLRLGAMRGHEEEVDSYFGPESLRPTAQNGPGGLARLTADADALLSSLELQEAAHPTPRGSRLLAQVRSFAALVHTIAQPGRGHFEQEALRVYGMSVPGVDQAQARQALVALDATLPGPGDLSQRLGTFYRDFMIPPDKRAAVFDRALQECRSRTVAHWPLPPSERLEIQWTNDVPAAWHRYSGHGVSTLQINPDAVALIGSAIDVACHEAYPGHHAQFLVMEQAAGAAGLPVEERVVLLRSPASVLREGAANFGVELAFPFEDRVAFDRAVLFPLAGLDPARAPQYETVHALVDQLSSAAAPILAAYRDGRLSFGEASTTLATDAQVSSPAALLEYVDRYGAYVLGYTAARDQVRDYVSGRSRRTGEDPWTVLRQVLSEPGCPILSN